MIKKDFWQELGDFSPEFFMYGEEADLCLQTGKLGATPIITPEATIVHYGGASEKVRADKVVKQKKVIAVASGGGHWVQLLRLRPAFENHKVCYVTTIEGNKAAVPGDTCYIIKEATRWNKFGLLVMLFQIMAIMIRVRPDVVITTGAAPGVFAIRIGKLLRARTIWIDSMANVEELSLSGQLVGPHADFWLTQWEKLERKGGPFYKGSVL